jgi:hypothetical protein
VNKTGKKTSASSDAWHALYRLGERIQELAPWHWMQENHIFGVKFPQNDTVGFVSVMGTMGEHRAVTVYLGTDGLRGFWHAEGLEPGEDPTSIFHVPQLAASFEDRNRLEARDIEQIRHLGLSYRGKGAWPLFRSYRPGYHPWFLTFDEVKMLSIALEQTLVIATRTRKDISLLEPEDEDSYLVRIPKASGDQTIWKDRQMTFLLDPFQIKPNFDQDLFDEVAGMEQSGSEFELDCLPAPVLIGPKGTRPRWPHILIVVEADSGLVVGSEFLAALDGLPAMWSEIPGKLLYILSKYSIRPTRIRVRSTLYRDILRPLLSSLKVDITKQSDLPALEEAQESLFAFLTRQ